MLGVRGVGRRQRLRGAECRASQRFERWVLGCVERFGDVGLRCCHHHLGQAAQHRDEWWELEGIHGKECL